jgi:hypothetical protein
MERLKIARLLFPVRRKNEVADHLEQP